MILKKTFFMLLMAPFFMATGTINPTHIGTTVPQGSQDTTNPYTDDVLLESITFNGTEYHASSNQFSGVDYVIVTDGRANINAEWGDNDTASDGNPDPFTRAGLNPADQESTDPDIQDSGLASAFHTLSLNEGIDGESGSYTFNMIFHQGIASDGSALTPEVVLFERGGNDDISIRAIIGGSFDNPIYSSSTVNFNSGSGWNTGVDIDTTEIDSAQTLFAIGLDLEDDFLLSSSDVIYGLEVTSAGADLYGQFLSAEDIEQFRDVPAALIPEPASALQMIVVSILGVAIRRRFFV